MSNNKTTAQHPKDAIWYYAVGGERKGPVTTAALIELYRKRIVTESTLVWRKGFSEWKPFAQLIKSNSSSAVSSTGSGSSLKRPIIAIIVAIVIIIGGTFGYFQFFATTPLDGGWQEKNILGVTDGIILFDRGKCWVYDGNGAPQAGNIKAVKDGSKSYKIMPEGSNSSVILLISLVDNNTINVSEPGSTHIYTMTRIDKSMAKSMMGIS